MTIEGISVGDLNMSEKPHPFPGNCNLLNCVQACGQVVLNYRQQTHVKYVSSAHSEINNTGRSLCLFSQASTCVCLPGSILPHCSKVVNTFAAACQATVKYCLCSVGPITRQLKNSYEHWTSLARLAYAEYSKADLLFVDYCAELKQVHSVWNAAHFWRVL